MFRVYSFFFDIIKYIEIIDWYAKLYTNYDNKIDFLSLFWLFLN